MPNIKKACIRLAIFAVIGVFAMLSAGCEIEPYHYGYHEDEGYHGYHHRDHHRHRDDDHDYSHRWK